MTVDAITQALIDYREAEQQLRELVAEQYPPGTIVQVHGDGHFPFPGIVHRHDSADPGYVLLILQHGEPRHLELTRIHPHPEPIPAYVRDMAAKYQQHIETRERQGW